MKKQCLISSLLFTILMTILSGCSNISTLLELANAMESTAPTITSPLDESTTAVIDLTSEDVALPTTKEWQQSYKTLLLNHEIYTNFEFDSCLYLLDLDCNEIPELYVITNSDFSKGYLTDIFDVSSGKVENSKGTLVESDSSELPIYFGTDFYQHKETGQLILGGYTSNGDIQTYIYTIPTENDFEFETDRGISYERTSDGYQVTESNFDDIDSYTTLPSTSIPQLYILNDSIVYPDEYQVNEFLGIPNQPRRENNTIADPPSNEKIAKATEVISSMPITNVIASSTLASQGEHSYEPLYAIDDDETTAWIEGADGLGIGEWIQFDLDTTCTIVKLSFFNGYGGNFENNGIISTIQLDFSNGTSQTYDLESKWNTITLEKPIITDYVKMTIVDATSSKYLDTGISELFIYGKDDNSSNLSDITLGTHTTVTPNQALAFIEAIHEVELQMEHFDESEYMIHAEIFDGGDGIPVLFLSATTNQNEGSLPYITQIWQWDGKSLVQPNLGDHLFVSGLAQKQDQYYLILEVLPSDPQYIVDATAILGFDSGCMNQKPTTITASLMAIDSSGDADTSKFDYIKDDLLLQHIPFQLYTGYLEEKPKTPMLCVYNDTIIRDGIPIILLDDMLMDEYHFIRNTVINEPSEFLYSGNDWHTADAILNYLEMITH